ncbi:unnamed protein product [Caenorhabditis auriculariae]|uniref:Uncharacterized protein n=1 Tax=Caenorhabditis auriculariae TaxID=2777116 RepID=A0A8S1GPZ9_9PELO|nr:unnamed protein product [Caenorhabditis auriculariae]
MSHVAFNVENPREGKIRVETINKNRCKVHLGMLLADNSYSVEVQVPLSHEYEPKSETLETDFASISEIRLKEDGSDSSFLSFKIRTKEIDGNYEAVVHLNGSSEAANVVLLIDCVIIEDRYGHPFIREGIKDLSHKHA